MNGSISGMRLSRMTTAGCTLATILSVPAFANESLGKMSQDPNQWVMPGGDYSVTRFSKLDQINHGEDASGGGYAPDLRNSLSAGMTRQQFISISMTGNPANGMPSWAGFFTPKEITQIYEYVKGRSVGLVPAGRPESAAG